MIAKSLLLLLMVAVAKVRKNPETNKERSKKCIGTSRGSRPNNSKERVQTPFQETGYSEGGGSSLRRTWQVGGTFKALNYRSPIAKQPHAYSQTTVRLQPNAKATFSKG